MCITGDVQMANVNNQPISRTSAHKYLGVQTDR